ncbi:11458_t:CDS:2, partial [Dentiscutata heterogama]
MELSNRESDTSLIELDLTPISSQENEIYCKCFLCTEEGHSGAWKPIVIYSESSNLELSSDENNDSYSPKINMETQSLFEISKDSEILQESSNSEYLVWEDFSDCNRALNNFLGSEDFNDYSDHSIWEDFFNYNRSLNDFLSSESSEDDYSDYSQNDIELDISEEMAIALRIFKWLTIQYRDFDHAAELRYRANYVLYRNDDQIGDIFD